MLPRGDKQFLETPLYGLRQMARYMKREGHACGRHPLPGNGLQANRERGVRRLMRLMRLVPICQESNTRKKHPQHKVWRSPLCLNQWRTRLAC